MEGAQSAIIATYQVDMDWLLKKCPVLTDIPVMLVHSQKGLAFESPLPIKFHLRKPSLPLSYGCCHGKIMVIKYGTSIRVAVTTANLLPSDYNRKTQGLWVQDFPLKIKQENTSPGHLARDFQSTLEDYVKRLGVPTKFDDYSFENVKVVLLTSVPGYHKGADLHKYGHMKVKNYLSTIHDSNKSSTLIAQVSSVGSLSEKWVKHEFMSSLGGSPGSQDESGSKKKKRKKSNENEEEGSSPGFQFVWPTVDFVRNSVDGYNAGSSLCFGESNLKDFMNDNPFFFKYTPSFHRMRVTPHIKTYTRIITTSSQPEYSSSSSSSTSSSSSSSSSYPLSWVVLTSANLSKAAWGSLQKDNEQLMIRHYEAGILFLPHLCSGEKEVLFEVGPGAQEEDEKCITIRFPLPYTIPLQPYRDSDKPWIWDRKYIKPDVFGKPWRT